MRDKIIALAMCALLAVSLFACGNNQKPGNDSDVLGDEQHQSNGTGNSSTNGTTSGTNNGSTGGTTNGSTNGTTNGNNGTGGTNGSSSNGTGSTGGTNGSSTDQNITGNNAKQSDVMGNSALRGSTINPANGNVDRTATWEQMLENGRVHDRDGFLFDGENSHWA